MPWLTRADIGYLSQFEFGPMINMAATDLADALLRPALALRIRALGLGLALHPQLHLLQLTSEEHRTHFAAQIAHGGSQPDRFVIRIWRPGANADSEPPLYKASGDITGQIEIHH